MFRRALAVAALFLALAGAEAKGAKKNLVYLLDRSGAPMVWGFKVDTLGVLTPLKNSPFIVGSTGNPNTLLVQTLGYSKKRQQLFVANDNGVNVLDVKQNGQLLQHPTAPVATNIGTAGGLVVVERFKTKKKGVFVYVTDSVTKVLRGFESIKGTGDLVELPGSPFTLGVNPIGLSYAEGVLCVVNSSTTIQSFLVGKDGALTPAPTGPQPLGLLNCDHCWFEPNGAYVYSSGTNGQIVAFEVNPATADLSTVSAVPMALGLSSVGGLVFGGNLVAFATRDVAAGASDVQALRIQQSSGKIQPFNVTQDLGMANVDTAALNKNGRRFVVASNEDGVRSLSVNPETGGIKVLDSELLTGNSVTADSLQSSVYIKR